MQKLFFAPEKKKFGDFDLIEKDNKIYCIFIENERIGERINKKGNDYGLATSKDEITWEYQGTIFKAKENNVKMLWAMNIFKENDYYLFYSSVKDTKDMHTSQQVGFAKSKDLINWENKGIIITNKDTADTYYPNNIRKFCWRDPQISKIDNTYYCTLAAKDKKEDYRKSGCVALLKSNNLKDWETLKPLFKSKNYWEIETPHIYKIENKYYLLFGTYTNEYSMSFAVSDAFLGEYKEPKNNIFTPPYCYAGRIIKFKNKYLFYHWLRDGNFGKPETYLAPPKIIEIKDNYIFLKKHPKIKPQKKKEFNNNRIKIKTKNQNYSRTIEITKTKEGVEIKEDKKVRILPIKTAKTLEILREDKFMEVYLDNYFVYSVIMEYDSKDIEEIIII